MTPVTSQYCTRKANAPMTHTPNRKQNINVFTFYCNSTVTLKMERSSNLVQMGTVVYPNMVVMTM